MGFARALWMLFVSRIIDGLTGGNLSIAQAYITDVTDAKSRAQGLGLIGAMFVRSLTVYLVRQGTLSEYVYLEHGAHWAIGALAVILIISIGYHISEFITGLLGVAFIGAALLTSIRRNRALAARGEKVGTAHA